MLTDGGGNVRGGGVGQGLALPELSALAIDVSSQHGRTGLTAADDALCGYP